MSPDEARYRGLGGAERAMIVLSVMLATVMQALDTTIANVALPHMRGALSASIDQVSWVLTSYIVAAAIATPLAGALEARLGRRKLFLSSVIGFTVASALCGLATSLPQIVVFRILQGVAGAALVPLSQAVLLDAYPTEKHGQAMALWGIGVMVGPVLGPTLGGYLTQHEGWRWVFYINVPVGVMAAAGVAAFVRDIDDAPRRFDGIGFALMALAVGALQLMFDRGQGQGWFSSTEIVVEALLAASGLWYFILRAKTAEHPFFSPELFRDRNFTLGCVFIFAVGLVLLSTMALLPPFLQQVAGYPVFLSGLVLAPRGFGSMAAMLIVGRLSGRIDTRLMIVAGLLLSSAAQWMMGGFTLDVGAARVAWTGVLQGFGTGMIFVPLSTLAFATLRAELRTEASALFSLVRNVGSSAGVSMVMTLLARDSQRYHQRLGAALTPFRHALRSSSPGAAALSGAREPLAALGEMLSHQASGLAYLNDFRLTALITAGSCLMVPLLRRH